MQVWPVVGILINLVWSALNVRTLANLQNQIRKEFMSREECVLTHKGVDDRHVEVCRRLHSLERRA
jgi:hypothetical protein